MKLEDHQLRDMAYHINYEMQAMELARSVYSEYWQKRDQRWMTGLECFLLHVRILHDFFSQKCQKDDVTVAYYVTENLEVPTVLSRERERINKHLAHLTLGRIEFIGERTWPVEDLRDAIWSLYERFIDLLPASRREWFARGGPIRI